MSVFTRLTDPTALLATFGVVGVFVVMFAETGLLVGFFLPGDSLLFTAGVLAAAPAGSPVRLSLPVVVLAAVAGALLGAQTGFWLGRRGARALLRRSKNVHLHRGVLRGTRLLNSYGPARAVVLARFIPVVRTVLNPLAGMSGVPVRTFVVAQVCGGVVWACGVPLAGYLLGRSIPGVDRYLLPIIAVIVAVSLIPVVVEAVRARREPTR